MFKGQPHNDEDSQQPIDSSTDLQDFVPEQGRHIGLEQMLNPDLLNGDEDADDQQLEDDEDFLDISISPPDELEKPCKKVYDDAKYLFQIALSKGILDNYALDQTAVQYVGITVSGNFEHSA
ncbi:hypothetical protein MIR68_008225 [Amoeboaphelidium protococcarum]|nr:hypothetical protein MIR68_008225 [Amoeboaphelidium protococcarum]